MTKMWFKAICKKRFRNVYLLPIKDKLDRIDFDARDIAICADRRPAVYSGLLLSAACDRRQSTAFALPLQVIVNANPARTATTVFYLQPPGHVENFVQLAPTHLVIRFAPLSA